MSFNGSGTFNINSTGQPVVTGTVISSSVFNALTADLATGLSTCITKDGQTTVTANIPMNSFKFTNLAAGTAAGDSVRVSQLQAGSATVITVTGTDTYTGTMSPALAAYAAGNMFTFVVPNTNTTACTINIDGLGAKSITRDGSTALVAGDLVANSEVTVIYDGTRFQVLNSNSKTNWTVSNALTLSAGTANGVAYLNGSKALTTGSALVFDGTNLGIGTSSPGAASGYTTLDVSNATNGARVRCLVGSTAYGGMYTNGTTDFRIGSLAAVPLNIITGSNTIATFDTSGNLGLGGAPKPYLNPNYTAVDFQSGRTALMASSSTPQTNLLTNAYYGTSWQYSQTGYAASNYMQQSGVHSWYTAPSGTAGNAITFTQAMTLDAGGTLLVGATSPAFAEKFQMYGNYAVFNNASYTGFIGQGSALGTGTASDFAVRSSNALAFLTGGATERARITAAGDMGVGTSAPIRRFQVHVAGSSGEVVISNGATASFINVCDETGNNGGSKEFTIRGLNSNGTSGVNLNVINLNGTSVAVAGALSKGSGSFKIDHPLKPDTHHLVHSFIEGPQADLIYRGKAALVNGRAEVNIDSASGMTDGTFVALCREVQCFTSNESDWDAVRGYVSGNKLTIECQNSSSSAVISWLVIGERQDKHMYDTNWTDANGKVIVEPEKVKSVETK